MTNRELIALTKYANTLLDRHERGQRMISPTHARGLSDNCQHRDCVRRRTTIANIERAGGFELARSETEGPPRQPSRPPRRPPSRSDE